LSTRPFSRLFAFLELYYLYVSCVFCTRRLTAKFTKENRGLGLAREMFLEGQLSLVDEVLNQTTCQEFRKYGSIFKKGSTLGTLLKSLQIFELYEACRHKYSISRHVRELSVVLNDELGKKAATAAAAGTRQNFTSIVDFLNACKVAMKSRGFTAQVVAKLAETLQDCQLLTSEIERIFKEMTLVLEYGSLSLCFLDDDMDYFRIILEQPDAQLKDAKAHYMQSAKALIFKEFQEVVDLDEDGVKRIFTCHVPRTNSLIEENGVRLASLLRNEEHFIRFLAVILLLVKGNGRLDKRFKCFRDHIRMNITGQYTINGLVYATGIFQRKFNRIDPITKRALLPETKVAVPLPKRCDFEKILHIFNRLRTWEPLLQMPTENSRDSHCLLEEVDVVLLEQYLTTAGLSLVSFFIKTV